MEPLPTTHIQKGTLLIATPDLAAGIFFRSVVLICEHTAAGSFGLIINKELNVQVSEDVFDMNEVVNSHISFQIGGPVQTAQMMLLHTESTKEEETLRICDKLFLGGDLKFLQESIADPDGPEMKICFGYASWGSGQLEREYLDGSWFIYPATKELVFDIPAENLWRHLLREMGGKYATLSMIPNDLSVN